MMEKLIPFDFEAFQADPSRLRTPLGRAAEWAEAVHGYVVAHFDCDREAAIYAPCDQNLFRLAAKTRIVRVRLFRNNDGDVFARTSDGVELDQASYVGNPWVSDIIEVEVTA